MLFPAGVTALVVAATVPAWLGTPGRPLADWALVLAVCATLFVRRRLVAACAAALVVTVAYYVLSPIDGPVLVVVMLGLYRVAAEGRLVAAGVLGAATVLATALGTLAGNEDVNAVTLFMMAGWVVALVALGGVRHGRREALREAVLRAEEEARLRAVEERLRIAREVHDAVGHHLSMINVQAGTALYRLPRDPAPALTVIRDASRDTLRELRSTLGVLRQADPPAGGLDRLDELVRYAELAGLKVARETEGAVRELPKGVDLAAFRILQESITNVTRHAAAESVRLTVAYGPEDLRLEVRDDGAGTGAGKGGAGIRGMRERARALGGDLAAGPVPGGGFRVRARLPYGEDA
ncbi:histidine kinase [Spirillospora sp. NPDC029432]|uniref:sensor histidine kinase n=1 Tax=Spirillospora sp. NPDC029432 TaxID=3154599 RepID=UPI003456F576